MRLVLAGTPATAVPSLEALLASRHEVVAVVTRPDSRSGRGRTLAPSPVRAAALEHGLEVLTPASPREPGFLDRLRAIAPDCSPVVAYGALLPREALEVPAHGWVNLHFSLLPAWRGAAPVQRAIMAGDEVTGASTFVLEEGLDTGPVLGTVTEQIRPDDTAGTLLERLADVGAGLLVATMDGLEDGSLRAVPQPEDGVSLAPKLTVEECEVRWSLPPHLVDRQVRGCTPDPGAWSTFRGERLKIGPVHPGTATEGLPALGPGVLHPTKRVVYVGTAAGPVALGEVVPPGKTPMPAADWARGVRIDRGECLG
ncbi:methionyl-tRNA formyltransferase [Phycicoccus endophyticus]|uniref:Methionyl-tRNA formyltransferase n=1 Tax=Phycicoccus endophyticus TaxID=1690220 RepID=A0A7G9R495_9MICO|nr:methionyl-tRNA formyltransferase [Phycicoccus endophyticus]NHI18280.1 methionyl-tRNA formyltransferase [Phycicoccus endophyticus]QNN50420.1 methionyl-tRNA formyltransferase [Phycicoccus endophyticus]GGL25026.1 methionyl-tRNA formyltransferase [Phycicoccus endophyticus]